MKFASKYYQCASGAPIETQTINDESKVELYEMNETPVYDYAVPRGTLSLWTSVDGKNYRLFVEKEYYASFDYLHTKEVNQCWINYFDSIEKIKKNYSLKLMYPVLLGFCLIVVLLVYLLPNQSWILLVGLAVIFVLSVFGKKYLQKKMMLSYQKTIEDIKNTLGDELFNKALEDQEKYKEEFYTKLYNYDDDKTASNEEKMDEVPLTENSEEEAIEEEAQIIEEEPSEKNTDEIKEDDGNEK